MSRSSSSPVPALYGTDAQAAASWVATASVLSDGAIKYTDQMIQPYYANLAVIAMAKNKLQLDVVGAWMRWYVAHLNMPDKWGLSGTIYDYNITSSGALQPTLDADSTDSYAASFLSLARAYFETGDLGAQAYIRSIRSQLAVVAGVITATQQSDGLTIAKPDYAVRYVMDNSEVFRGVSDYAVLLMTLGDATATTWSGVAARIGTAIESDLWDATTNTYFVEMDASGGKQRARWNVWYPDATAQLFPIVNGVIAPASARAVSLYGNFNQHYPSWSQLHLPDQFPWAVVSDAAVLMGDRARAGSYVAAVQQKYANKGFPWPWYCAESGWYIRTTMALSQSS